MPRLRINSIFYFKNIIQSKYKYQFFTPGYSFYLKSTNFRTWRTFQGGLRVFLTNGRLFTSMPKKRKRCVNPALYCDVCMYLDSIGGLESNSASRKIRSRAKKAGKTVECMGHRSLPANVANYIWDHTVWTCNLAYSGKSWEGLKEDCHILQRGQHKTQVCKNYCSLYVGQ